MYEEDFVKEEIIEFEIEEGKKFKYKPVTAGEENEWLNEYMIPDKEGKLKQDVSKVNKCKIKNLREVPYDKETINKIIGISKEWSELDHDQRWNLLCKLKPKVFSKIIEKLNEIDDPKKLKKKD